MEAIISARKLKEQVGALQGIIAKKESIPILGQIKIEADGGGDLTMTATDLDVSLISSQEVDVLCAGSICLNGKKLAALAGALPDEPLHLKLDRKGERVEFRAGRFLSRLAGTSSGNFPEIARVNGETLKIPAGVLYEALRRTAFAVTEDQKRFTISGVLLKIENSELITVSTDGHRLCICRMKLEMQNDSVFECLVPIKAVRELTKILSGEMRSEKTAEVKIKKGGQLEFEVGSRIMTAREISGNFPNWEMVVPKDFSFFAEIKAADFSNALARVGVLADDVHRRVEFCFYPDKLLLKAESPETGFSTEEISCTFQSLKESGNICSTESEILKIAFNAKYLTDFLSIYNAKLGERRVVMKFGENGSQVKFGFEGEEQIFSYILVPLKN